METNVVTILGEVKISSNAKTGDKVAILQFDGESDAVEYIKRQLNDGRYGHYGHPFNADSATLLDLQAVLYGLKRDRLIIDFEPMDFNFTPIPDDATS